MAFNFNWTPLAADTSFYARAQELLTQALNKSPKPPIIVDDIVVHEMNLGSVPPDLEILEVGDLAEDRFRGIFKMTYAGDAFLTLKTRVQANPLNTYLSARPAFGSPEPLFADSGLTIPLKITLSDIKLSAFIILVFSKQKGVTLVFRNDPLESLKVSSTFDSISFVRNYLQKEIEGQLRTLLMDDLPSIIHRLSLRLLVPEYRAKEDEELARDGDEKPEELPTDPFASPPQDPVDINGNVLDANQIASLSLDSSAEVQSLFSRKNLLRLAALSDSSHTLSLFSPPLRDVVFRAWSGPLERGEVAEFSPYGFPLSRKHSQVASASPTRPISDSASQASRPGLQSHHSFNGSALGRHNKPGRKRKHRVVNMRKPKVHVDDSASVSGESSYSGTHSSASEAGGAPLSEPIIPEEREVELVTPPLSPQAHRRQHRGGPASIDVTPSQRLFEATPRQRREKAPLDASAPPMFEAGPPSGLVSPAEPAIPESLEASTATIRPKLRRYFGSWQPPSGEAGPSTSAATAGSSLTGRLSPPAQLAAPFPYGESNPGGILEQAWMMKMAGEIARRVEEQKRADAGFWAIGEDRHGSPPPAYTS